jgi:hypothetical protein
MGGGWGCAYHDLVRMTTFRDVLREYWRILRGRPPLRPDELSGPLVCRRCGVLVPDPYDVGGRS